MFCSVGFDTAVRGKYVRGDSLCETEQTVLVCCWCLWTFHVSVELNALREMCHFCRLWELHLPHTRSNHSCLDFAFLILTHAKRYRNDALLTSTLDSMCVSVATWKLAKLQYQMLASKTWDFPVRDDWLRGFCPTQSNMCPPCQLSCLWRRKLGCLWSLPVTI